MPNRPQNDPYDESSWSAPDPFFVGDDEIRPGIDYTNLPGTSESISSDFFSTSDKKVNFIPILIIGFLLYRYL
jgi:hypothetical protein